MSRSDPRRENRRPSADDDDSDDSPGDAPWIARPMHIVARTKSADRPLPTDQPGPAVQPVASTLPKHRDYPWDRKRRHTGSDTERGHHPQPTYGVRPNELLTRNSASGEGIRSSRETSSAFPHPPSPNREPRRLTINELMMMANVERQRERHAREPLPRWQLDEEADKCPVCQTEFTFWYRKHHCRKCGRVVCNICSPHRITIPREFIVQPPNSFEGEGSSGSPGGSIDNTAIGGGQTVRVCKPCVPDPWPPQPQITIYPPRDVPPPPPPYPWQVGRTHSNERPPPPPHPWQVGRTHVNERPPQPADLVQMTHRYMNEQEARVNRDTSPVHGQSSSSIARDPPARGSNYPPPAPFGFMGGGSGNLADRPQTRYERSSSQSNGSNAILPGAPGPAYPNSQPLPRPTDPGPGRNPTPAVAPAPASPRRRREVKEEDECPVCGVELPPAEALREIHIRQCIVTRFSSTPTQPSRTPPSTQEARAAPPSTNDHGTPPVASEGSRPRATSYRSRGMALYRATEKDCTTEDGEPQECVICFEEFEAGDEMGRLECLCKFHRDCIRQWWERKGQGSCPTHQLHD